MTFEEFTATAQPVTDEVWQAMLGEDVTDGLPRTAFTQYGEGYVLHQLDGKFYPHAWWYRPAAKDTLEQAVDTLYQWRKEWVNP